MIDNGFILTAFGSLWFPVFTMDLANNMCVVNDLVIDHKTLLLLKEHGSVRARRIIGEIYVYDSYDRLSKW